MRNLKTRSSFFHYWLLPNLILLFVSFNTNVFASDETVADSFILYVHGKHSVIETPSNNRIKTPLNISHFSNFDSLSSISFFDKYAVKNHNARFMDFSSMIINGTKLTFFPVDDAMNQNKLASKKPLPLLTVFKFEF